MAKDVIYLIDPGFHDSKREDGPFVCPFCNQIEGLLASFPDKTSELDVVRVPFPRPRRQVIDAVGEANQGLPVLVLGNDPPADAQSFNDRRFISETPRILDLLAERHGFPRLHRHLS